MGTSRRCILIITLQLISIATAQEAVKRGPQGFLGMRGKKLIDSESIEQFYKRKPQFFVGVKGKKSFYDILESPEVFYKRAPMGFMGMRGKKDLFDEGDVYPESYEYVPKRGGSMIGQIDYVAKDNVDDPKFPFLNELIAQYIRKLERPDSIEAVTDSNEKIDENEHITNEVAKRASNIHQFFGVRGKKSVQSKRPFDLSFRGKFIGVRGKKDLKNSGAQEIKFLLDQNRPYPKRKGQMGFIGMRGKKWIDESSLEMETPNSMSSTDYFKIYE